jgi:hypothetical protein
MVHQVAIEELKNLSYRSENKSRNKGNQQKVSYSKNHTNDHHDTLLFNVLFHPLLYSWLILDSRKTLSKIDLFSICNLQKFSDSSKIIKSRILTQISF